jgi:serine/threonine protein kinase
VAVGLDAPQDRVSIPRQFGRYQILDRLGRGGMGAVFRAVDTQLDRTVALKVPFLANNDAGLRERFYREARAAAALHHPNICPVFDVGELDGLPYLTMAFLDGRPLADALADGRPFPPHQAALLVRKLALAMQYAHDRGVIHRDLKPGNVLLRPDGEPVVMDFGLARRGDDPRTEGMTRQGDVIGTIEYMSPEQFEGDNAAVGPASDVYSLGVVLYELLTGRRPYEGGTASKMASILFKPPPRPSDLRPGLPVPLEEICLRAMAKRPADRYPSMAEFAAALTAYLRSRLSGVAPAAARTPAPPPTSPTPPPTPTTRPVREGVAPRATPKPPPAAPPGPDPGDDPGWELVEDPPPPSPPRPAVRARLVKPRKRAKAEPSYRPVILGGAALAVACLSLAVAAVIRFSGGPDGDGATVPATQSTPARDGPWAKPPTGVGPAGEVPPASSGTPNR